MQPSALRSRFRPASFVVFALALLAACLQGARAPEVAPRGTLAPGADEAALGKPAGPFGVVFASPKGETVDPSEITIVWNRPMRPLEVAGQETRPPVVLKPEAPGHWIWVGSTGVTFTPEGHLAHATEYTVEVPAGTRALDGGVMDRPFVLRFSTARPRLESASPNEGPSDALTPQSKLVLRFNQPVDEAEVARAVHLFADHGKARPAKAPLRQAEAGAAPLPFEVGRPDPKNAQLVELTPKAPLALDTGYRIDMDPSLHGHEGPLPAGSPRSFSFHTFGPLTVTGVECNQDGPRGQCVAESGLSVQLSNQVKVGDIKRALRIEPALKIHWQGWQADDDLTERVFVSARFVPGRSYRVSLSGLRDRHGQPLAEPFSRSVAFDDLWPSAAIGLTGTYVEPGARRPIPVASVNVKDLELATAPLDEATVLALQGDERHPGHPPGIAELKRLPGARTVTLHPAARLNAPADEKVVPEDVLGGKDRRGPFGIAISYTERPGTHRARSHDEGTVAQVTDLAVSAKVSPHGSVVWVTRLSNAAPVEGANVRIASPGAPVSAAAVFTTDRNGFAVVPESAWKPAPEGAQRGVIFVRLGDDWAYRPVAEMLNGWRFGVSVDLGADQPFGMMFTDRGIYRPGDEVHVKGILREEAARGISTPAGRQVDLSWSGPDGEVAGTQTLTLSPFGTLSADLKVPETGRLGTYSITASVKGSPRGSADVTGDFEVAEYRPAEFKVAVEGDRPSYVRGDKASWTAHGDYLFGAPMAGADAFVRVTRSEASFAPPGADDFVTDDGAYRAGRPEESEAGYEILNTRTKLDAKGIAKLEAALTLPGQHGAESVTAEAEITDLSRQTLAGSTTAIVHPGDFYLGVKPGADLFVKAADPVKPEVIAVQPKGGRVAGVPVTVELIQRRYTVAKQQVGGGHRTETTIDDRVVATCSVTTAAAPVSCSLQPSGVGYYLIHVTGKDRRGNALGASVGLYATGDTGETSWRDSDTLSVELVPDRKSYEVGQTAHVLVKSPFKSAEAWVAVERGGVYSERRTTLSGPMPTVDVPITDDLRPNAFVSVLLVRGRTKAPPAKVSASDVGAPAFRAGYAALPVNPEGRRLTLALRPSKAEARPGDPLDVDVDVKDRAGKPAQAEVTLYAVDEGVLSLVNYKTPDPLVFFGAPRALKVATIESREALARVMNPFAALGLDKGLEGGDGSGARDIRRDFRASAYWGPALVTDAAGHVHASFKLPDGLTTYRVMAVASAQDDRFGYAEDRVVTSRPLMARPAFPRFLRAGDSLEAGVVVTSKGLAGKTRVEVEIAAEGLTVKGDTKKTVDLDPGASSEVRFAIETPRTGTAKVSFRASGGGAEDRVEITREVKVPAVIEAAALYGDTAHEAAEKLGDLSAVRDDVGGLDVSYASTALVGLGDGVEQLIDYPYGCTEQLTSRLVPMLPLRDLATDYNVPFPKDLDRVVAKTVADILGHQRGDGGFGLWADSSESWPWVTAYALWGLGVAKDHKATVPDFVLESATRYLRDALPQLEKGELGLATIPFVLDVLAERGSPDPGRATKMFEIREKLPLFSQALLLHAMAIGKSDPASIEKLAGEMEGHLRIDADAARAVSNTGDHYAVLMDSETRTSALVLRALLTVNPDHPLGTRLARGLLADRRGGTWRNTQETAWALLALDAYRKAQEKTEPDFIAHVFLGQAEVASAAFHGRSLTQPRTSVLAARLVAVPGAPLGFTVEGQGHLFYEARLRYARKTLPTDSLDRGFYIKKTLRVVKAEGLEEALRTVPDTSERIFGGSDLVLGDVVVVTPSPRTFVVIDDPLPAGLEAVDARLATTGTASSIDAAEERAEPGADPDEDAVAMGRGYRASDFIREIRDDRVLFFVDRMPPGMFHYRYLARATSLGSFVLPQTVVQEMYTPEVFGRTGADRVEVRGK
jgi:alpha-2-macroglobulin